VILGAERGVRPQQCRDVTSCEKEAEAQRPPPFEAYEDGRPKTRSMWAASAKAVSRSNCKVWLTFFSRCRESDPNELI
jgi:hypothetical protein